MRGSRPSLCASLVLVGCSAFTPPEAPPDDPDEGSSGGTFEAEGSWSVGGASGSSSSRWVTSGDSGDAVEIGEEIPDDEYLVPDEAPATRELALALTGFVALALVLALAVQRRQNVKGMGRRSFIPDMGGRVWRGMDVTSASLVVDRQTRARLRAALAELEGTTEWTRSGLVKRLHAMIAILEAERSAWRGGAVETVPAGEDAESRYREALARGRAAQESAASRGAGRRTGDLVVTTLVVAARTGVDSERESSGLGAVEAWFAALDGLLPGAVAGLEVVFSPDADNDGLTARALSKLHPGLSIDDGAPAPDGEPG